MYLLAAHDLLSSMRSYRAVVLPLMPARPPSLHVCPPAGQSSTMTGTYTGQFVMSGFLDLKVGGGGQDGVLLVP
jgi:hypothetical protein